MYSDNSIDTQKKYFCLYRYGMHINLQSIYPIFLPQVLLAGGPPLISPSSAKRLTDSRCASESPGDIATHSGTECVLHFFLRTK